MVHPLHEAADERLLQLIACAAHPVAPDLAGVAAAGRSVWTWHGVSRELDALLGDSPTGPGRP